MSAESSGASQYTFKPLPEQEKFMKSTADQVLLSGSFGAGKSRTGCEKGYLLGMKYPGNRGLIVRKHFSDVKTSTIKQTLLEEVIPDSHLPEGPEGHNKGEHEIYHKTGETDKNGDPIMSEIHYHGLDSGESTSDDDLPRKIGSTAYGWIFVDEGTELTLGEWSQLQGRLRYTGSWHAGEYYDVPFRQIFTATNPASPQHWMYDLFMDKGRGEVIRMNVEDNPYVPEEYVERMERTLSGRYYDRYFLGKWVGSEGMIFDEWDPDVHYIDADQLRGMFPREWRIEQRLETENEDEPPMVWAVPPSDWRIYRGIDFGYNNPAVCLWVARSPDDDYVVFRQIYETEILVDDLADRINRATSDKWAIEQTFADHDSESAEVLRRNGVATQAAKKDVSEGIQAVKRELSRDDRGRPTLYVLRGSRIHEADQRLRLDNDPTKIGDEFGGYTWKDSAAEDEPNKENDHGLDALRYVIYSIEGRPSMSIDEMREWEHLANTGGL